MENNESLVVTDNYELIIDDNTKLMNVKNKDKCNKLVISKKIKPVFLSGFKNIKELTIDGIFYNEEKMDKLSFKNNIEKIVFKDIKILGIKRNSSGYGTDEYILPAPNLRTIELPDTLININPDYLYCTEKLETIIFNVSAKTKLDLKKDSDYKPLILPSTLKNIVIKTEFNCYDINLNYIPKYLSRVYFNSFGITMEFYNNYISTIVRIDNNNVTITNTLTNISDNLIIDKCLFIPDFINDIKIEGKSALKEIDAISINPQKFNLSNISDYRPLRDRTLDEYLYDIKKIIIRSADGMKLNPNRELTVEEYGELKKIYFENQKLQIVFAKNKFTVDKLGNIEKSDIVTEKIKEENVKDIENNKCNKGARPYPDNENNIKKYSSQQLEYYCHYKKLLELFKVCDDKELNEAMNLIEKRLVKILKLDEKED